MSDANYLSPGVYIQELEGPAPIVGVSTSIAAFIGMAERGPVNVPILCTSPGDYTRWFGGLMIPDEFADNTDPKRFHCYLPYAVAGFFNNSGQVTYVIRVLPPEATAAWEFLYDRTGTSPTASALMRSAAIGDGAGTTPETGALIMLSPVPPANTSIRLDDGSVSEYATIQAAAAVSEAVALDLPLSLSHAKGTAVGPYARNTQGAPPYTLAADVGPGQTVITVVCPATDHLDKFNDLLIELVDGGTVAIVVPQVVVAVATNNYAITLTQPLISSFAATTTVVTALVASPAAAYSAAGGPYALNSPAALHATSLSVHSPTDDLSTIAAPWLLELANGAISTVVTVTKAAAAGGNDYTLTLSAPLSMPFVTAGTTLTQLNSTPASALEVAASGGDMLIFVPGGGALALGELVDIDPANPLAREIRMVGNAKSTAPPAPLTQLSFTPPSSVDWPAKTAIIPVALTTGGTTTTLTAEALAGARTLSLASRKGINEGSVLLLGTSPKQEYASVIYVPGVRATAGPDPGPVTLGQVLVNGYTNGATVAASTVNATAPASRRATQLVLDAPVGSTSALVSWGGGWTAGDIVEVQLADGSVVYTTIDAAPTPQGLEQVQLTTPVQRTHPAGSPVVSRNPLIQVQALDAGAWGQRIALAVQDEAPGLVSNVQIVASIALTQLKLSALTGIQPGSYLELLYPNGTLVDATTPLKVAAVNRSTTIITLDAPISGAQAGAIGTSTPTTRIVVRSREFRLTAYLYRHPDPAVPSRNTQVIQTETFRNLTMDPRHSQYFQTVIGAINGPLRLSDRRPEGSSWLIRVQDTATTQTALWSPRLGPEPLIDVLPNGLVKPAQHKLDIGGDDSLATVDDTTYIGADAVDPKNRTGTYALLNAPDVSIVAVPGQATPAIQSALIDFCETSKYQFAVLDPRYPDSAIADIQAQRQAFDTKYAAIYYPWFTIADPMPSNLALVPDFHLPPSGHVVGIYARVDDTRGVFKAPANEVVQGITGLTQTLVEGDQDVLNPAPNNINVIRDFRPQGRGIRVWGARVITSDDNYKYVPVRRLLIFIERSLNVGLQDVVFEPNTPQLWASVERVIGNFLYTVWLSGAFAGATPEQSFFVRCDQTTMTPDDIDAGRLIALVGVAPAMPAEFVIIQIALMTATTSQ
jgi:phage tail sheath protein FI